MRSRCDLLFLFTVGCAALSHPTSSQPMYEAEMNIDLRGPIAVVETKHFLCSKGYAGSHKQTLMSSEKMIFNDHDQVVEETHYGGDGKLVFMRSIAYDDRGRLWKEELHYIQEDSTDIELVTHSYGGPEHPEEIATTNNLGVVIERQTRTFDDHSVITDTLYAQDGTVSMVFMRAMDKDKRCIAEFSYGEGGTTLKESSAFSYRDDGQISAINNYFGPEQRLILMQKGYYDAKGHLVEWDTYRRDGSIKSKHLYWYNEKGVKTKEVKKTDVPSEPTIKISFKVDDYGNWIEKRTSSCKKGFFLSRQCLLLSIETRDILLRSN